MAQQGNITQFNSPVDKLTPAEAGPETLARVGRIEDENYRQAGEVYGRTIKEVGDTVSNYEYQQEVSTGAATLAVMNSNLSKQWNALSQNTDPNDTSIQQKFMDEANQKISDWQGSFGTKRGQDYALNAADQMRNHLWEHTSADMSARAGTANYNNMKTTLQGWSDTAYNDPTTIPHALGQVDTTLAALKDASSANVMNQEQADRLNTLAADMKNEIVKNGLKGVADGNNPQQTINALNTGKFDGYLNPQEIEQLKSYANTQAYGQQLDKQNQAKMKQQQVVQAGDKANGDYLNALTQGKMPSASQIISDPNLSLRQKNMWIAKDGILNKDPADLQTASLGDNFAVNAQAVYNGKPLTTDGLLFGIRRGDISPAGAAQLQKMQAMQKTPAGMAELQAQKSVLTQVQSQIVKGGPYANDPVGQAQYNNFLNTFYTSWDAAIKKGATPADLSNPASKDYIGNLAQQFKRSDAQAIADVTKAPPKAAPAAPKPGDADIAFLKANPSKASAFDKRFGAGASKNILGGE